MESGQYDSSNIPAKVAKSFGFPENGTELEDKTHVWKYLDVLDKARQSNKIKRDDVLLKSKKFPLGRQKFSCCNCQAGFTMYFSSEAPTAKEKTGSVSIGDSRPCTCETLPPTPNESTNNTFQGSVWEDRRAWQAGAIHEYSKQGVGIVETQKSPPQDFAGEQMTPSSRIIRMYCRHTDGKWSVVRCRKRESKKGMTKWIIEKFPNLPEEAYGPTNESVDSKTSTKQANLEDTKMPAVNKEEKTFDCSFCGEVKKKFGQFQFVCCSKPEDEAKNVCNNCLRVACFTRKTAYGSTTIRFSEINKNKHAICPFCKQGCPEYIRVEDGRECSRHDCPCPYGWRGNRPFLSKEDYDDNFAVFDEKVRPLVAAKSEKKQTIDLIEIEIADMEHIVSRFDHNDQQIKDLKKNLSDMKIRLEQQKESLAALEKMIPKWADGPSYDVPMHMLPKIPRLRSFVDNSGSGDNSMNGGDRGTNIVDGGTSSTPIVLDDNDDDPIIVDDNDDTAFRPTSRQRH